MIFFNFEKMWLISGGESHLILEYFHRLYERGNLEYKDLKGNNFILNEEVVLKNTHNLSNRQLSEYLGLCALRNYANYKTTGDKDLDLEYFPPWIPKQVVDENPLVAIKQSKLIFIEE